MRKTRVETKRMSERDSKLRERASQVRDPD